MKTWLLRIGTALAAAFLVLTVVNASWLAPAPVGSVKLIAHRGVAQTYDPRGVGRDTCTAARIERPVHTYLENTVPSIKRAWEQGATMVEVDIAPTSDGEIALFHDWTLDCRTDGSGNIRDAAMAELKALDIGYGYTADDGETYPFRGDGEGAMPELSEALSALPRTPMLFNFKSADPAEADLLAERLREAGRDVEDVGDGFYGPPAPVERIAEHFPGAWTFSSESARECSQDYVMTGWTGFLPESCEGGTMIVPLDDQWMFWGWPNRLMARMEDGGGRVIVIAPHEEGTPVSGIRLPEQLGQVPASFNGYLWVEDIWTVAPALYPSLDRRRAVEIRAANEALDRRRARMGPQ